MKLLMIATKRVLSYFEIVTSPPRSTTLYREKTPARMTLPTISITDPKFVYQSAACTDISQTFEKVKHERLQRLQHHADENRKQDQSTVGQMPKQKLRRVHG